MRTEWVFRVCAWAWLAFAAWAAFDSQSTEVVLSLVILGEINIATASILRRLPAR